MLHSIILMFSQYRKNSMVSNAFKGIWILYAIAASFFYNNLWFSLVNISVFILVTGFIRFISKLFPKTNSILSVCSIMLYSLFIDIVCYYLLPSWRINQSLVEYIMNGFLFNYKYVLLNIIVFVAAFLCSKCNKKFKTYVFKKYVLRACIHEGLGKI